jgi:hypothetical protein
LETTFVQDIFLKNSILDSKTFYKKSSGELPPKNYLYKPSISPMGVWGIVYFGDYMTTAEINNIQKSVSGKRKIYQIFQ